MQGIYKLEFKDGSIYVGQSVYIEGRWAQHLRDMEGGRHTNKLVQSRFDKFGPPSLAVLEYIEDASTLTAKEAAYIKKFATGELLNIQLNPRSRQALFEHEDASTITLLSNQTTQLQEELALLTSQVDEILPWVRRKMLAEAKERDYVYGDVKVGPIISWKSNK